MPDFAILCVIDVGVNVHIGNCWLPIFLNAILPVERRCCLVPETVCHPVLGLFHQRCDNAIAITHSSPAVSWTAFVSTSSVSGLAKALPNPAAKPITHGICIHLHT